MEPEFINQLIGRLVHSSCHEDEPLTFTKLTHRKRKTKNLTQIQIRKRLMSYTDLLQKLALGRPTCGRAGSAARCM